MPMNPLGRLVMVVVPAKSPFLKIPEAKKLVTPVSYYEVGNIGKEIIIRGKQRLASYCPECFQYVPVINRVRFGKFLIGDDLKYTTSMKGFESWESCHFIDRSGVGKGEVQTVIDFFIDKKSMSVATRGYPKYSPSPKKSSCDSHSNSRIQVRWEFNELK